MTLKIDAELVDQVATAALTAAVVIADASAHDKRSTMSRRA
ncbi:MAG: hypothetical protein ABI386_01510 [Rhodanobacter sp.]